MVRLATAVNSIVEKILFVLLTVMTIIVMAQVLFRYVFHAPLYWTEEAARYLQIWIVFMGASVGIRKGSHLGFTWFVERAGKKMQKACAILSVAGLFAFSLNILYYGWIITAQNFDQLSPGLQLPIAVVYFCLPVSGVLNIIQLVPILMRLAGMKGAADANAA